MAVSNIIYNFVRQMTTTMNKATKKEVYEMTLKQVRKYEELVWFARAGKNIHIPQVLNHMNRVSELYPEEITQLESEHTDFYHGFNSGMLAGMRLIFSMMESGPEMAEANFPELDT